MSSKQKNIIEDFGVIFCYHKDIKCKICEKSCEEDEDGSIIQDSLLTKETNFVKDSQGVFTHGDDTYCCYRCYKGLESNKPSPKGDDNDNDDDDTSNYTKPKWYEKFF